METTSDYREAFYFEIKKASDWGKARNLQDGESLHPQLNKLTEEFGELVDAISRDNSEDILDAVGDMLVVLTQMGGIFTREKLDAQDSYLFLLLALTHANNQIQHRTGKTVDGVFIKDE